MELHWTHKPAEKLLKCVVFDSKQFNQELYYTTSDGGGVINKYFNDVLINSFVRTEHTDPWEQEKEWLSEQYSENVGIYKPMWHLGELSEEEYAQWEVDNNWNMAMPLYGISKDGVYLDRLQRHSYVQEGRDMENVVVNELEKLWIEKDSENNYYKREWCEENNSFYNVQPCCVFPDNPGRTLLKDYSNNLQTAKLMARHLHIGTKTFDGEGEKPTDLAKEYIKLKEFAGFVKDAKLVNNGNQDFVLYFQIILEDYKKIIQNN